MRHLAAAEAQGHLDLVAFLEEPRNRAHLHVVVVIVDARAHLDLFDLDDLLTLAGLGGFLLLLVLEFAIVEDLADGRLGVGRNLHEIEPGLLGTLHGVETAHNADILIGFVDQTDVSSPDRLIDPRAGCFALGRASRRFADFTSPSMASVASYDNRESNAEPAETDSHNTLRHNNHVQQLKKPAAESSVRSQAVPGILPKTLAKPGFE